MGKKKDSKKGSKKDSKENTIIIGGAKKKKFANGNKIIDISLSWDALQKFYKKAEDEYFKTVKFEKHGAQKMINLVLQESKFENEHSDFYIVARPPFVPTKQGGKKKKK